MPHKHNAARRHRIGKMKFKVANWAEYDAGLRQRGSLTLWVTEDALVGWAARRRKTRGGPPLCSDRAIETTLMLGMAFGLRLRQSEGLLSSVLELMGLDLPVPDHTTRSRRAGTWMPSVERRAVPDAPHRIHPNRWSAEMAGLHRLWQAGAGRNGDGQIQGHDWAAAARSVIPCSADRGRDRRRHS